MRNLTLTAIILTGLAAPAFAKGHDQSGTDMPGMNVGAETVATAQILGSIKGNGKGAQGNLGNSAAAGGR